MQRLLFLCAGLMGMAGIGLAAAASHLGDPKLLGNASTMLLAHAPALLALGLWPRGMKTAVPAALVMILGVFLFSGDLVCRHYWGSRLFPMSAPLGGMMMMAGWLLVGVGALFKSKDV